MRAKLRFTAVPVASVALLAVIGAACGDDSSDTGTGAPGTIVAVEPTSGPTPDATEPDPADAPCPTTPGSSSSDDAGPATTLPGRCGEIASDTTAVSTGTGTGTYEFSLTQPVPQAGGVQIQTASLDIELLVEGSAVTGTIDGPTDQLLTQPSCPSGTVNPGRTTAEVEGTLTEEALSLTVVGVTWQRPTVDPCPAGGPPGLIGETTASGIEGFEESLSRLERADDGVYRYDHIETIPAMAPFTVEYHVAIRIEE
jgi:hypothetical protein